MLPPMPCRPCSHAARARRPRPGFLETAGRPRRAAAAICALSQRMRISRTRV